MNDDAKYLQNKRSSVQSSKTPSNMLNQAAVEELYSGTYLANYLQTMENLPEDLQRQVTTMKELDFQCRELLKEMEVQQEVYKSETSDCVMRRKAMKAIQRCMIRSQEIGDEKLHITSYIIELIENRSRQLDQDLENLDPSTNKEHEKVEEVAYTKKVEGEKAEKVIPKRQRRQKQENNTKDDDVKEEPEKVVKKRRRRTKKEKEESMSVIDTIDPDEPLYCLCDQVSYGEMIGCDYEHCVVEWFHFNCVGLYTKPKGKWYCPTCRGDKPSVKRADLK